MIKINAAHRLKVSANWFDSLSEFQKKEYVKEHPNSKYSKGWKPNAEEDIEDTFEEGEAEEFETLGSRLKAFIVEALGGSPNRVYKTKQGFITGMDFPDENGKERNVKCTYTKGALAGKGETPYGYWKDENNYVFMSKKEWKSLNKEQKRNLEERAKTYGIGTEKDKGSFAKGVKTHKSLLNKMLGE